MSRMKLSGHPHVPLVRCGAIDIVTDRHGSSESPIYFAVLLFANSVPDSAYLKHQQQRGPLYDGLGCFVLYYRVFLNAITLAPR